MVHHVKRALYSLGIVPVALSVCYTYYSESLLEPSRRFEASTPEQPTEDAGDEDDAIEEQTLDVSLVGRNDGSVQNQLTGDVRGELDA